MMGLPREVGLELAAQGNKTNLYEWLSNLHITAYNFLLLLFT